MVTKLTLQYDGTNFAGWSRQPGLRTVEGEIERALRTVLGERDLDGGPLRVTVAGRTDRGVHAWGQVASYAHEAVDPRRLNGLLDHDLGVVSCEPASAGFDARVDARTRTYCYRILNSPVRNVFEWGRSLWVPTPIDRELLAVCASALVGCHDFTAFTPTESEHVHFHRTVIDARWIGDGDLLELWIEGDSFLRHMVRILVGTMVEVATGRRPIEEFRELLAGAHRREAGPTVSPAGLALVSVSYGSRPTADPAVVESANGGTAKAIAIGRDADTCLGS